MRKVPPQTGEFYHIYNRGVDKREIFYCHDDFARFIRNMRLVNNESKANKRDFIKREEIKRLQVSETGYPVSETKRLAEHKLLDYISELPRLVEIICYCLMSNHYHLILKQLVEDGISKFMQSLNIAYSNYFNTKYNRTGTLFESKFKSVHLKDDDMLLWTSGYVNGNSQIHKIAKAENYQWCSYQDYLNKRSGTLCNKNIILNQFKDIISYREFVELVIEECQGRKDMQKLIIE